MAKLCIFILLLVSCNNTSRHRRLRNNTPAQTGQFATKPQIEPLQIKKGEVHTVTVVGIADGDTFTGLNSDNQQVKCRIYGIDAPEDKQPFSDRSKQLLSGLIFGKQVQIKIQSKDRYRRAVVWVFTNDGKDISAEMLNAGMAWHYKQYSKDNEYAEFENQARRQKVGLWIDNKPIPPWEFRKAKKKKL